MSNITGARALLPIHLFSTGAGFVEEVVAHNEAGGGVGIKTTDLLDVRRPEHDGNIP